MPTPPTSPCPGESVSPPDSPDSQSGLPESGAIDLTESPEKTATSPSPQAAARKQRIGGGRQKTLERFCTVGSEYSEPCAASVRFSSQGKQRTACSSRTACWNSCEPRCACMRNPFNLKRSTTNGLCKKKNIKLSYTPLTWKALWHLGVVK
jgi:hypothetical protein